MIDDSPLCPSGGWVSDRWLRVFLAVVDTGSFTRAGQTLGIGQPAVSHAMKQMETALGATVFDRENGRVVLTDAGRRLADGVRSGFEATDRAVRGFRLEGRANDVELSVSMPLATYWLLPRLADFRAQHPEVELRVATVDTDRLIGIDDADLWIPAGLGDWPDLDQASLHQERIYPVAAPDHPLARPDTTPAELAAADVLVHGHHARFGWDSWFARHDHPVPATVGTPRFGDYSLVLRAAEAGQGVALGWDHLVRNLIHDGVLARVGSYEVVTDNPLVVLARPASLARPAVRALRDWLLRTAAQEQARLPDEPAAAYRD